MPKLKNDAKPSISPSRDAEVQQKLETLRQEYNVLHTKKITTDANIKNLEKNLDRLRASAEQEYGTSDLEKLREILETRRQENEMKVAQYEQHVKEIKEKLATIEEPQSEGP
jgi:DNA repair exonuclease SbcCD ATPase subunit